MIDERDCFVTRLIKAPRVLQNFPYHLPPTVTFSELQMKNREKFGARSGMMKKLELINFRRRVRQQEQRTESHV